MTMLAAVLRKPGQFDLEERPVPTPGEGEALIRISRVGICGTDLHMFNGHYAAESLPLVPGHEFTGVIAALGPGVTGLQVGDKAVVDMNIGCGACYWCRRNEILNCPEVKQIGIGCDGAFAEYLCVPARLVITAPAEMPDAVLALTEPLACVVRAARKSGIRFAESVAVLGAGPIGNLHVQLLRTIGAAPIIVSDIAPERVDMALEAGADIGVSDPALLKDAVLRATDGRGVDLVIESVGSAALYAVATTLVRKGGHLAAFGVTPPDAELSLNLLNTVLQENAVKGSVAGMGPDMHDALTLLTHGRIKTEAFTRAVFPLTDIQAAFESVPDRPGDLKTQITLGDDG